MTRKNTSATLYAAGAMLLPLLTAAAGAPAHAQWPDPDDRTYREDRTYRDDRTYRSDREERLPEGTVVKVRLLDSLNSRRARTGDRVRAEVSPSDRSGLPAGTVFVGRVTEVRRATESRPGEIGLRFNTIERNGGAWQTVSATPYSLDRQHVREESSGRLVGRQRASKDDQKMIGYGAAGGALLGMLLKNKTENLVLGALLGAAAGYAYNEQQKKQGPQRASGDVDMRVGSEFGLYLERPLAVRDTLANRSDRTDDRYYYRDRQERDRYDRNRTNPYP